MKKTSSAFLAIAGALVVGNILLSRAMGDDSATPSAPASPAHPSSGKVLVSEVIHDTDYRRPVPERLRVVLHVLPNPDAKIAYVQRMVRPEKATDDKGNSLLFDASDKPDMDPTPVSPVAEPVKSVELLLKPFPAGTEPGTSIKLIEGTIPIAVVAKTETISLDGPGKFQQTYDGVKVNVVAKMTGSTTCEIVSSIDLPKQFPLDKKTVWSGQFDLGHLKIKVVDSAGNEWPDSGRSNGSSGGTHMSVTQTYNAPQDTTGAPPLKISFDLITETSESEIPFHVENTPLP